MKVLIADKLSAVGIDWLKKQSDVELDSKAGIKADELARIIGGYDGVIIRSGVKITADVLAEPGKLKCIARAGVGVDNVDVPVATAKGIIVMNTPGGNTLSTAELAFTLMLALSRKIAPANASLRGGAWDRKSFEGTQLAGKTLGIIGMGRIGRAVAARAASFDMRVLGYDPFFAGEPDGAVEMVKDLMELCKRADFITVHTPKTAETTSMIGAAQIAVMKPSVRLINAARGGIIDEEALLKALNDGLVAGAALDVYIAEPPASDVEKALVVHPKVLAVPHLGASTEEAQEQVALAGRLIGQCRKVGNHHHGALVDGLPGNRGGKTQLAHLVERLGQDHFTFLRPHRFEQQPGNFLHGGFQVEDGIQPAGNFI